MKSNTGTRLRFDQWANVLRNMDEDGLQFDIVYLEPMGEDNNAFGIVYDCEMFEDGFTTKAQAIDRLNKVCTAHGYGYLVYEG